MSRVMIGQLGRLKADKIDEYERLHKNPWSEVLKTIHECNMRNYSIFRHEDLVFACFEYTGEDYQKDMEKMELCPYTQQWWSHTKPCFVQFSICPDSAFYGDMKQIFYLE